MTRLGRLVVLVIASVLLISQGGAIVAAPVTLPLLAWASSRTASRGFRAAAVLVAGLTIAECAWAFIYVSAGEAQPAIWLVPVAGGVTTTLVFAAALSRFAPRS